MNDLRSGSVLRSGRLDRRLSVWDARRIRAATGRSSRGWIICWPVSRNRRDSPPADNCRFVEIAQCHYSQSGRRLRNRRVQVACYREGIPFYFPPEYGLQHSNYPHRPSTERAASRSRGLEGSNFQGPDITGLMVRRGFRDSKNRAGQPAISAIRGSLRKTCWLGPGRGSCWWLTGKWPSQSFNRITRNPLICFSATWSQEVRSGDVSDRRDFWHHAAGPSSRMPFRARRGIFGCERERIRPA
jgi:hypothetical protein